ncbi:methanogenesis marker 2 protein [soil metagenome]
MSLQSIVTTLRASRGFAHKRDIADVVGALESSLPGGAAAMSQAVAVGDDCAAIADGDGYLLFAIEGLVEEFVERMPWFAGYCSVMVNVSDIYAMGGRPIAVVDALWSNGMAAASPVLAGMAAASQRYGVPIVGGHSNNRSDRGQIAVSILGRASSLLTSFDARPGDKLVMAIDLRGAYEEPYAYWNCSTEAPAARLRADLELLPRLAEDGLCKAAKDISMAGAIGTALMLLECSRCGASIDLDAVPRPESVKDEAAFLRWLSAFPSFGFILSVAPDKVDEVRRRFAAREIDCAVIGEVQSSPDLTLHLGDEREVLWNIDEEQFIQSRGAASLVG